MSDKNILVVEDDPDTLTVISQLLELNNFSCVKASCLADARQAFEAKSFDAMLLDYVLPDGDGFSYVDEIHENESYRKVPIIMLTGFPAKVSVEELQNPKIYSYIEKPYEQDELLRLIKAAVEKD